MPSEEYLNKIKEILNEKGDFTDEEIMRIGIALFKFYKTIQKIMEYGDYNGEDTESNNKAN